MANDKKLIRVGNRVVGTVVGKLFIKQINGSQHFLRAPHAIAFDKQSLRQAYEAGATDAMVIDKETGIAYCASLLDIYAKGIDVERGFGKQIALPVKEWNEMKPAETDQPVLF